MTDHLQLNAILDEPMSGVTAGGLNADLLKLLESEDQADVTFILSGGKVIRAHECILFARHPTFAKLWFESGMKESHTRTVEIEDVQPEHFMRLLRFVYGGDMPIATTKDALEMLTISNRYLLESVVTNCEQFITRNLEPSIVLSVLSVADACRLVQLKARCLDIISTNFGGLVADPGLELLSRSLLVEIIGAHARQCKKPPMHIRSDSQS